MTLQLNEQYKFVQLQMAAEAFLMADKKPVADVALVSALTKGNSYSSKFTLDEAQHFAQHWRVLDQVETKTGFSGTLFICTAKDPATGALKDELVMSFRSTEFVDDAVRDNIATNELEIKETGWAWGQLRDMDAWYTKLRSDPSLLGGKEFSVTGYSLGGHLATAFNLMHAEEAAKVVTFNGAGVGQVESWNPTRQLDEFEAMTAKGGDALIAAKFQSATAVEMYRAVSAGLAGGWSFAEARYYLNTRIEQVEDVYAPAYRDLVDAKKRLDQAMGNMERLEEEGERLTHLKPGNGNEGPRPVAETDMEALSLDYQLAISFVANNTAAASLFGGLWRAYMGKQFVAVTRDNQYDLQGHEGPSAVANSQWHAGADVPVYIEDQPLFRGDIGTAIISQFLKYGVKLLQDQYATRDFGDTHSLVLIQDSLAVQNLMANLLSEASRNTKQTVDTLTQIFEQASNLRAVNGDLIFGESQGRAIGDIFENVLNAFSHMLGLAPLGHADGPAKHLEGNSAGNTWAEIDDKGPYTGRTSFYEVVNLILKSDGYGKLAESGATFSSAPSSASQARGEFGNLLALLHLSPFALSGSGVGAILGEGQQDLYDMWTADKALTSEELVAGKGNFTDVYLDARAAFGQRVTYFNTVDAHYDVTAPITIGYSVGPSFLAYGFTTDVYTDLATDLIIRRHTLGPFDSFVSFGTEQDDTALSGGGRADKLFGNGGNDVIDGGAGDDHLEGNAGADNLAGGAGDDALYGGSDNDTLSGGDDRDALMGGKGQDRLDGGSGDDRLFGGDDDDTYAFSGAFGHDVIVDHGAGAIEVDGQVLEGGERIGEGRWEALVAGVRYTYVLTAGRQGGTDLVIQQAGGRNSINIQNWTEGDLGIFLEEADQTPDEPAPGASVIEGSIRKRLDASGNYVTDANYNYVSDGIDPEAFDLLRGTASIDTIRGHGGNDMLDGHGGDDLLEGGAGDDLITGGFGSDTLIGGAGKDFLYGSAAGVQTGGGRPTVHTDLTLPGTEVARGFSWVASRLEADIGGDRHPLVIVAGDNLTEILNDGGNVLDGGAGDDFISAGSGDDLAHGGDDDDTVIGDGGADVLFGDDGDDELQGDGSVTSITYLGFTSDMVAIERHGADILDGGAGNDKMWGHGKDDQLYGGAGDDFLWGDSDKAGDVPFAHHGNDYLDGGDGTDQLVGNGGHDQLFGGAGKDMLFGDAGAEEMDGQFHGRDLLDGGADDDYLVGGGEDDRLRGGDDGDVLWGDSTTSGLDAQSAGNDDLDGGDGDDFLYGGGKDDRLVGGAGNDQLVGDAGSEIVAGEDHGNDVLDGGEGDDKVFGTGGNDVLFGGSGEDDVEGDAANLDGRFHGDDELHGGDGKDKLFGGGGKDVLFGDEGDDFLHGDYDDLDQAYHGDDQLDGGVGDDTLVGGGGDDVLRGGAGVDALLGEDGDDTLHGDAGDDYLVGGAGDDHLIGGDGNDVLDGGAGNNILEGGAGDDTYLFNNGSAGSGAGARADAATVPGALGINDNQGRNKVVFSVAVTGAKVEVVADATPSGDLVVKYGDSVVRFKDGLLQSSSSLTLGVSGAPQLTREELLAIAPELLVAGSAGDDNISGGGKADVVDAGDGNDIVRGGAGADTLAGGAGDDVLGGDLGNDIVSGGFGNDSYMFSRGGGNDRIDNAAADSRATIDQLLLGPEVKTGDVTLSRSASGDLYVALGQDSVTIVNHFGADGIAALDRIVFADGTIWGQDELAFRSTVRPGGPGSDTLNGGPDADILYGLDGSDTLNGNAGDDTLYGGNGWDTLSGGGGNDTLEGGTGNDTLKGNSGNDTYVFQRGDGDDDIIELGSPDDVDTLQFGAGIAASDIMLVRTSSGLTLGLRGTADKVGLDYQFYSAGGSDKIERIRFVDGTTWDAAMLPKMVLDQSMTEGNDQIEGFDTDDTIDGKAGDDRIRGQAGNDRLSGGAGDDVLEGGAGADLLDGGAGSDQLAGGAGADVYLFGRGAGSDLLTESGAAVAEADTIRLGTGVGAANVTLLQSGDDLVLSIDSGAEQLKIKNWFITTASGKAADNRIERIEFADGAAWDTAAIAARIVASGVADTQTGTSGDDLFVVDHVNDVIQNAGAGIDTVLSSVSYGTGLDIENLTLTGFLNIDARTNGLDNIIIGNSGNNMITSDEKSNDTLIGGAGNDTYITYGGLGKVQEAAGGGVDTVTVARHVGSVYQLADHVENLYFESSYIYRHYVYGNAGDNTIWTDTTTLNGVYDGGAGVDTIISRSGQGLFYVDNPLDRIQFVNGVGGGYIFSSGDYKLSNSFRDMTMVGDRASRGEGNDLANVLNGGTMLDPFRTKSFAGATGNFVANVLVGGKGDDTYVLGDGDRIEELAGEGNDIAYLEWSGRGVAATASFDNYANVEAIDLRLSNLVWTLNGNAQDNAMYGNQYNDVLRGGAGNDTLVGREGGDMLDGGAGADTMQGDDGYDTYVVDNAGDRVIDSSGIDTVRTSISYILGESIENLVVIGDGATSVAGNGGDNTIDAQANAASNLLIGGAGNDTYLIGPDSGHDVIDNRAADGATAIDTVRINDWIALEDVVIERVGDDLVLRPAGAYSLTVLGYFDADAQHRIDRFEIGGVELTHAWIVASTSGAQYGTNGADTLVGGADIDLLHGLGGDDVLDGRGGDDRLNGGDGNDRLAGGDGADRLNGGSGNDVLDGGDGDDQLGGDDGDDVLDGGIGADTLRGGAGDDIYHVDNDGDLVAEEAEEGIDTVHSATDFSMGEHIENVVLVRGGLRVWGNQLDNTFTGSDGDDYFQDTSDGADTYVFERDFGHDTMYDNSVDAATVNTIVLHGYLPSDIFVSSDSSNLFLTTSDGANRISLDNWIYHRNVVVVFDNGTRWNDARLFDLIGPAPSTPHDDQIQGTDGDDVIDGLGGNDVISGMAGDDRVSGGAGDDELDGGEGNDTLSGGEGNDRYAFYYGSGDDVIADHGRDGDVETVVVQSSTDYVMATRDGNDLVLVLDSGDRTDSMRVSSYFSAGMALLVEFSDGTVWDGEAILASLPRTTNGTSGADTLNGNDGVDILNGLAGNDTLNGYGGNDQLDGGAGADRMSGGAGSDRYYVDNTGDVVTESANAGFDEVRSSITYTLTANVENLVLTGTGAINGTGNALENSILGNAMANILNGGAGADYMIGGAGNDTYIVDNEGDYADEQDDNGVDLVQSSVDFHLGWGLDNLTLTGNAGLHGSGNQLNNVLLGNSVANQLEGRDGDDLLNGGAGRDTMYGEQGNDTYVVDNSGDRVIENDNEGIDLVQSSISYTLGDEVEHLTLTGSALVNGTGNELDNNITGNGAANTLTGGAGNDTIDGGAGADRLVGGAGNDVYVVDVSGDVVVENAGDGIDTVRTGVTTTLGANLEALVLTGTLAVNGTGNAASNLLIGNAANNTLAGADGNDILQGGAGIDTLGDTSGKNVFDGGAGADLLTGGAGAELFIGGKGNDTITTATGADLIVFNRGDGADVIGASTGGNDTISLGGGIVYADLQLRKSGNDLVFAVGAGDQLTLKDWYANSANRSVATLQMVIEDTAAYKPNATTAIHQNKIQWFDFDDMVAAFDAARAANSGITTWNLSEALLAQERIAGSDAAAWGGDLAYLYATQGTLAGLDMQSAQAVLAGAGFGTAAQVLQDSVEVVGVPLLA